MERLGVEYIDLYQIHALDDLQDLKIVMGPGGALEAMKEARENGLIILCAIVLLDRCEENGKENIEKLDLQMHSILNINDFT